MGNWTSTSKMPQSYKASHPPPFGHALLPFFLFDPNYLNLNHGAYGSCPRPVRDAYNEVSDKIESCPDLWLRMKYQDLLIESRKQLAALIGVKDVDQVVMVPNASHGLNTVLRSFEWNAGDVIIICNTTYNSINLTAQYLSDIPPHPTISKFSLLFPTSHDEIIGNWVKHLASVRTSAGPNAKIVAVIDGLISTPGCLLPWEKMTAACREQDVWSVIDAAHVIGQQVDLKLDQVNPDFWISNCHKWLFAKRSVAVLYVPKRNQHIIKATFPCSHAYIPLKHRKEGEYNFVEQFEWNGTIDFTPYLIIPEALAFREWLGGERKINEHNRKLALEGGKKMAEIMGTRLMDETGEFTLSLVNVQLPIPPNYAYQEMDMMFKKKLLQERNMFGASYYHNGLWWIRCSAQVFNELSDFETLAKAMNVICPEIIAEIGELKGLSSEK